MNQNNFKSIQFILHRFKPIQINTNQYKSILIISDRFKPMIVNSRRFSSEFSIKSNNNNNKETLRTALQQVARGQKLENRKSASNIHFLT